MTIWPKNEWKQNDLEEIILNGCEETSNIDFKRGDALINNEKAKKNIAKDVSAFANSAGGIIIYGIAEVAHVAAEFSFIDGRIITKEWIEQVITSNIQRKIDGLKIIPIRFDNDIKKSIYIVSIPDSNNKPHISVDKRFYKRCNFESVPMEEYEIRSLYSKKSNSKLEIVEVRTNGLITIRPQDSDSLFWSSSKFNSYWSFYINIRNIGIHPVDSYKLVVTFNQRTKRHIPIICDPNVNRTLLGDEKMQISPNYFQKILPQELVTAIWFNVSGYGIRRSKPTNNKYDSDFEISLF